MAVWNEKVVNGPNIVVHGCDLIIWEVRADRIGSQEYHHLHGEIKATLCNMRSCLQNMIQLR